MLFLEFSKQSIARFVRIISQKPYLGEVNNINNTIIVISAQDFGSTTVSAWLACMLKIITELEVLI